MRAGIIGVDQGQHEAAAALGIPRARQQLRIVLPQAMRTIVPTSVNEIIGLLKGTSVVYVLAYGELFYTVGVIYGRNLRVVPLLLVAAVWYLILTTVLTIAQFYLERHYARGALRTLPPTPLQKARWSVLVGWARLRRRARAGERAGRLGVGEPDHRTPAAPGQRPVAPRRRRSWHERHDEHARASSRSTACTRATAPSRCSRASTWWSSPAR